MADLAETLRFDPSSGRTVREPPGPGYGNWVGGKVFFDSISDRFTLFYRERRPLEHGRAGRCAVAVSDDGIEFNDVWSAGKDEFVANSIEEGHCVRDGDEWRLYVSYELEGTSMWRIDLMTADDPAGFDTQSRRTVLWPPDYGLDWIKDPFLFKSGTEWWLYAAAPPRQIPERDGAILAAGSLDATVRATSEGGRYFDELEYVFEAPLDSTWHGRRARINSLMQYGEGFVAFFDGGRTFYDNYEEKAGLATSPDGRRFTRLDTGGPWVSSPHGIVRYVDAVPRGDEVFYYYEFTRPDLSHELRVSKVRPISP